MEIEAVMDGALLDKEALPDPEPGIRLAKLTYGSQGLRVKGYWVAPCADGPLPGLVYCRGGIRSVGMVRLPRIVSLARRGYAVFAPFYRGNDGGEGRDEFGGDDRHDAGGECGLQCGMHGRYPPLELVRSFGAHDVFQCPVLCGPDVTGGCEAGPRRRPGSPRSR